jgi:triacylglycerol lipase
MNLVFASGFLVPQSLAGKDYFRGLRQQYPNALFPKVDTIGDVAERAGQLAAEIVAGFKDGAVHIVAHSMGGLDARYLLAKNLNGLAGRVASLSMIATPHWGSPVADLLTGEATLLPLRVVAAKLIEDFLAQFPGLNSKTGALQALTTAAAQQFNRDNAQVPGVSYYAYAGNGTGSSLLVPTHGYIRLVGTTSDEQDNDGLVSVASASWPAGLAEAPWATDHIGEVGYDLDAPPDFATSFPYLTAIGRVVARAEAG